ncbi:IS3 family transposase [Apilactobacillus kunkeei]|uniref:IS3 family transposase n=1 Tax=Apilactobacillus kunkeei TaxID=148814 RepID=UPI003C797BAD
MIDELRLKYHTTKTLILKALRISRSTYYYNNHRIKTKLGEKSSVQYRKLSA